MNSMNYRFATLVVAAASLVMAGCGGTPQADAPTEQPLSPLEETAPAEPAPPEPMPSEPEPTPPEPETKPVPPEPTPPEPIDLDGQLISHDFNDGTLGPFYPCTVKQPNYSEVRDGRVETYWAAESFDGGRTSKGAEFCEASRGEDRNEEYRTFKEGWMGFTMNVDSTHSSTSDSALAQVFGFENPRDIFTWEGLLQLQNGDLTVVHREGGGEKKTDGTVINNFEFGVDHDIVIGFVVSQNNAGMFNVWVNGTLEYSATDINFGLGEFDGDDTQTNQSYTTLKLGQYNHTDSDYESNEERIVYYDNVSWYNGTNGYAVVSPS